MAASRLGYLPEERGLYKKEKVLGRHGIFWSFTGPRQYVGPGSIARVSGERVQLSDKAMTRLDKLWRPTKKKYS